MEFLKTNENKAKIFTDYGHMASSINLGYMALKEKFPNKKILVIFQPHQINRIITGRKDFTKAIKKYDEAIIYDIYAARENLSELVKKIPALKNIKTLEEL
jgi:UDP-N-acetylmuramate--alanine ligase